MVSRRLLCSILGLLLCFSGIAHASPAITLLYPYPAQPKNAAGQAIAVPKTTWNGGSHHILWDCDPNFFGTAGRIELFFNNSFVMVLGNKYDCTAHNDFVVDTPAVVSNFGYSVRIVSYWLEAHPELGSDDVFSAWFTINSQPIATITVPIPWRPAADGMFKLQFNGPVDLLGTAFRVDLFDGNSLVRTMGVFYTNQTSTTVSLPDPQNLNGDFYIRVTSFWLESHPTPMLTTYVQTPGPVLIKSNPQFYFTSIDVSQQPESPLSFLNVGYHTEFNTYGSAYRVSLVSAGYPFHTFVVGNNYSTDDLQSAGFWVPPMDTDETAYHVIVESYWAEQSGIGVPSIQSETTYYIPNPRGIVVDVP